MVKQTSIAPPSRRASIRDVAARAGVSPMTVSNVLRGQFGAMSAETRARVEGAITQLNYRPQSSARELRTGRPMAVGMLIVDAASDFLADPFTTQVVTALTNRLNERGYGLVLQGVKPEQALAERPIEYRQTSALALLMSGPDELRQEVLARLAGVGQPMVVFQDRPRGPLDQVCCIRQDDREGGRLLGRHVLERGARRLAMLVPGQVCMGMKQRRGGVEDAIAETGAGASLDVVLCGLARLEETQARLAAYLEASGMPDAILAGNDSMGMAALALLKGRKASVPDEVMLTGFNAFEFWRYSSPLLTTVRSPSHAMGERAAEEVLHALDAGSFRESEIVLPVAFQPGETT